MKAGLFCFWLLETVVMFTIAGTSWTVYITGLQSLGLWGIIGAGVLNLAITAVALGLSFMLFTLWREA